MKKKGFTLAEVLITLTVIGVIAALTIPAIIQTTQNAELKAAFKNTYSILDQATKRILQDNAGSLTGVFNGADYHHKDDNFRNQYSQYLSYAKICDDIDTSLGTDGNGNQYVISNCWSDYNYYLNKSEGTSARATNSQAVLNNGASLDFLVLDSDCTDTHLSTGDACGMIEIDVNGLKGPNQYGKDLFFIYVGKNGLVPFGAQTATTYNNECNSNGAGSNGWGFSCAAKALQNQDY